MKATDIKVEHTNGDDIIAAYAALKEDEEQVMSSYAGDDLNLL
jgi:DNA-binding cell septation regulator SpoVG